MGFEWTDDEEKKLFKLESNHTGLMQYMNKIQKQNMKFKWQSDALELNEAQERIAEVIKQQLHREVAVSWKQQYPITPHDALQETVATKGFVPDGELPSREKPDVKKSREIQAHKDEMRRQYITKHFRRKG